MNRLACFFSFVAFSLSLAAAPVPLFDGKSLAGWEGDPKLWRVEEGMIAGGSLTVRVPHNDFLATTKSYSNFDLRVTLKLSGTGFVNSGVQIRSLRVPGSPEMSGYQVDYGAGWYGKLYDESRRGKVLALSVDQKAAEAAIKEGDWNEYRIRAEGPRIQSWINGVPALDYAEAEPKIAQDGFIGIQIHSGGMALVQVKEVTIEELPPTPDAPTWEKVGKPVERPKPAPATAAAPVKNVQAYNAIAAEAKTPEEERLLLKAPEGYEVELVAAEDVANGIGKFVPIAFDAQGRLWTTTALEYPVDGNENPAAADALYASHAKDKVLIYDRDSSQPTGYAKKPRVFADGLAIPLGVLPYKNGCYVLHGHDIVFMEDTDGDGKADKTTVILTGFGVQDSHLFPHQFTRAPGGWIWMAQGAFNYGKVSRPGDEQHAVQFDQTRMAKFRPDGSGFDITSNGPCNIWGLVLTGEGEAFIQEANDFGYPLMPFHEYGNYPGCSDRQWKSYSPEFPGTPNMKMGGTGLSGLALTDKAGVFPAPWADVMLIANPITNRINAVRMHRDGPRWAYEKLPDFMESADPWFRPVAITIGPDGCLYIVDWYNKIISHNEVPRNHPDRDKTRGRIWRVKPTAAKPFDVPDFTKLGGDELVAKLGGSSLTQSHLAWQAIGDRGMKELAPKLQGIVAGREADGSGPRVGRASRPPADASRVGNPDVTGAAISQPRSEVPGGTPGTAGGTPALPEARRVAALWALENLNGLSPSVDVGLAELAVSADRNLRREFARILSAETFEPGVRMNFLWTLLPDEDPEVRCSAIRSSESLLERTDGIGWSAFFNLMNAAKPPLAEPVAPSTKNGKPIKVREAYDREFERYLVRLILERHQSRLADYLAFPGVSKLPVEAQLLASLALEPKVSAPRVAALLPQLQRAPGQEEILRLAQFPAEAGVGEALRAVLASPKTSAGALEALLALKTRVDATKLAPLLADAAKLLLDGHDPAAFHLGLELAGAFKLAGVEPQLVAAVGGTDLPIARAALHALAEVGSSQTELFAKLADASPDPLLRDEALLALAGSRAADAPARVLALYPKLSAKQRHTALERLSASKAGAGAVLAALSSDAIAKTDVDASVLDRLQAVLGANDPTLAKLVDSLGALFRPVLALDGTEEAWTQTAVTLDGPCTIETWVKLDPQGRKISNVDGLAGAPKQLDFNFAATRPRVYAFPPHGDVVIAKKPLTPGLWTHVAATRDATGLWKIYIDGELDNTAAKLAPGKIENLRIAWTSAKGGTQGALSDYRLWNRERSADEIRAACDRSLPAGTPGLVWTSTAGDWGQLQAGAKVLKTSDFPPILTADEATVLDAKYTKFRALANQPGDVARGQQAAALCQACHLMGPVGGNIGPNLSGVGAMGTEAILRNILQPNAAMENGYRIYRVELQNGDIVDALYVSEDKDAVVIRQPGAEDRRLPRREIRDAKYLRRSLMPEGLLETFTAQQVSDLFAFLRTLK